ncbi:YbaB/EbfC family DNA-binding protein [Bordetella petrii]|nr:YbaB/EbfC family DNA-binding protein [Bordetella petrii]
MSTPKLLSRRASVSLSTLASGQRASWLRRVRNWLAGWAGVGLVTAASTAAAQSPVPQHWIAYAQLAGGQLQSWLSDETSEAALRLQEWGRQRMSGSGGAAIENAVVLQLWVAADGAVERVEFASLGDAQADADLRQVLTAQSISEPPPKDMQQPMMLGVTLAMPAETPAAQE